ncbi:MAG: 2Fe-2S iron-sulfur cluster-binding protein [Caulobacteraceae bacterium]
MANMTVVLLDGREQVIAAEPGRSVMAVIKRAGIYDLQALCGGCCSCATCHVHVDPAYLHRLPPMTEDEDALLDSSDERTETSRLSCQVPFEASLDGVRVTIAKEG